MWDVGGQATKLWKHYFDKIDAILFVIDANAAILDPNGKAMQKSKTELHKMAKDQALSTVPILLMVNKIDLVDEAYCAQNKDESDLQRKKDGIEKNRKQVQDEIVAGLDIESLYASVLTGQKPIENDGDDESQIG